MKKLEDKLNILAVIIFFLFLFTIMILLYGEEYKRPSTYQPEEWEMEAHILTVEEYQDILLRLNALDGKVVRDFIEQGTIKYK